ncbi:MAG: ketoacyl-ACP synthase III [Bacteroidales bacterium]|nr:ketoacyl-ACP synthase III [Bacteroidales bacterium]
MRSFIEAISYHLPEKVLTNQELASRFPGLKIEDLTRLTGVTERHIAADGETSTDLAVKAAEKLFKEHSIDRNSIDFILFNTQWSDYITPASACVIQDRLKILQHAGALDISQGCTGHLYGLSVARGLIETGSARKVLLLTSDTITRSIHPQDKSNQAIFGDGAAATLVSATSAETGPHIGNCIFGTDGSGYQEIIIRHGGARYPLPEFQTTDFTDNFGNIRNDACFHMNGAAIFSFSVKIVPEIIERTLKANQLNRDDIDFYIFHQANRIILETLIKKNKIPADKTIIFLDKCGNTVSSTIPIALYHARKEGRVKKGDKVLLAGFGVGLSWAGSVVEF